MLSMVIWFAYVAVCSMGLADHVIRWFDRSRKETKRERIKMDEPSKASFTRPLQPLIYRDGVFRFESNAIVCYLLEFARAHGVGMNELAVMNFSREDREQFAQLIGYSLSGFSELSYVSNETYEAADCMARNGVTEEQARIQSMRETMKEITQGLKQATAAAFRIHPDDLEE
jgi:hypothetical protein